MKLLSTLRAGVRGAENGSAQVFARGGDTEVQYYQDFEGQIAVAAGTPIVLNAYGQATVYVDQLVNVQCWTEAGLELDAFVEGDSADVVELISEGALGTDYETGEQGVLKPTTVAAQYGLWIGQNGAAFPKVLLDAEEKTIQEVLASFLATVFNVKDVTYGGGAVGDGVEDDTAAIAAAVAACNLAGGGTVFFPAGTYLITGDLSVPDTVTLQGVSFGLSILRFSSCQLLIAGPGTRAQFINDLDVRFAASSSLLLVEVTNCIAVFTRCRFNQNQLSTCADGLVGQTDATGITSVTLNFRDCIFRLTDGAGVGTQIGINTFALGTAAFVQCRGTNFFYTSTIAAGYAVYALGPMVLECRFILEATTTVSGTAGAVYGANGGLVVGCNFEEPSSSLTGNYYCMRVPAGGASELLVESGNKIGDGNFPTQFLAYLVSGSSSSGSLASRDTRFLEVSGDNDTAFTADFLNFGSIFHKRTNTGDQTISITKGPEGSRGKLTIDNTAGGGTIVFKWGSDIAAFHAWEQLLAGETRTFEFEFYLDSGTVKAREVGYDDLTTGMMRLEQSGLASATVTHDFNINSVWDNMPSASRFRVEYTCELRDGGDGKTKKGMVTIVTSGDVLSSLVDQGAFGAAGITPSISGGNLRITASAGTGDISAMQTKIAVISTIP